MWYHRPIGVRTQGMRPHLTKGRGRQFAAAEAATVCKRLMPGNTLDATINSKGLPSVLTQLYGRADGAVDSRFRPLTEKFQSLFKTNQGSFFSSPGRTEITGNHTDHN